MTTKAASTRKELVSMTAAVAVDVSAADYVPKFPTRAIYIGSAGGNLKVDMLDSGTVTFTGLPIGTVLRVKVKRIYHTGTTSTGIVALF